MKKVHETIAGFIYLFLISFFCYTAVNKLMNLQSFRINLVKTSLFSEDVANWFSVAVIIIEIVVILILLFYKKVGLFLLSCLILIFTVYISFLRFKGLYEVCGCGGVLNGLKYSHHLSINIALFFGALYSTFIFNKQINEK